MKIDVCKKGIPEEGIPPLDDCKPKEALQVANQVVDYVVRQAEEGGVNLSIDYRRGRGYDLRMMLERAGQRLHYAYAKISSTDKEIYQGFEGCLDRIIDLIGTGRLLENAGVRKRAIAEYHQNSHRVEELTKRLFESI